ncbi:uncharacterized protein LOC122501844 [Leptopilina heterotoma]|uniref:uncharacterized protein LOC122501844 n=1 Tax=Leptopilina heterotoma TaxID=63436 RepID=UPI001CA85539|nr:uncharacterized protein LOC122501844 [Leptopilina heterotoma]XP_043467550.1 uncharacterized protein LOC122501844 [Leptopilina heterotoma]
MKLLYLFFFLIVGVFAYPSKQDVSEESKKVIKSLPFMAIVSVKDQYYDFCKWAIILTEKWLLTSFDISAFRNNTITVRVYTNLFNAIGYEYGVESTRVVHLKDPDLYPTFSLIELQNSIDFGDSQKSISLAEPNFKWQENEEAYYLYSDLKNIEEQSKTEYFLKLPIKVSMDEGRYEVDLNTCLNSTNSTVLDELECDPVILNGTVIGFRIHTECKIQPFFKISSIYETIFKNIPELCTSNYQILKKENIIITENFKWKPALLEHLLPNKDSKMVNFMEFNNVTFNIKVDNHD